MGSVTESGTDDSIKRAEFKHSEDNHKWGKKFDEKRHFWAQ